MQTKNCLLRISLTDFCRLITVTKFQSAQKKKNPSNQRQKKPQFTCNSMEKVSEWSYARAYSCDQWQHLISHKNKREDTRIDDHLPLFCCVIHRFCFLQFGKRVCTYTDNRRSSFATSFSIRPKESRTILHGCFTKRPRNLFRLVPAEQSKNKHRKKQN